MTPNVYSSERPASPDIFQGYSEKQPGTWNLEEVTSCFLQITGVAPSFWIAGERKLGKTSFLLKLESRLLAPRSGGRRGAIPLYIGCQEHPSLLSFYRGLLARARTLFRDLPSEDLSLPNAATDDALSESELLDLLAHDLASVLDHLSSARGRPLRLVLLIDDMEAVERSWGPSLFHHLRAILTQPPCTSYDYELLPENMSVVVAGCRGMQKNLTFAGLTDVLEEISLRPLITAEVGALITSSRRSPLEPSRWLSPIYKATAGHPWLVQFIMEQFVSTHQEDPEELARNFETITTTRFQKEAARSRICRQWLESLSEEGVKVLAHLALDPHSDPAKDLLQRTGLSVKEVDKYLQQMAELGIIFKPLFGDRYGLGEIFKSWFLEHTGGKVFLDEIEFLQRQAASLKAQASESGQPFTLFASTEPEVLLADGFNGRKVQLQNFKDAVRRLERQSRRAEEVADLDDIAEKLQSHLKQRDWEEVWKDYARRMQAEGEKPTLVFRFSDEELLEFPVEMLKCDGEFLGLTAPVYKEFLSADREPAYRVSGNHFPVDTPLNVLLVASSSGGEYEGRRYSPLPRTEEELIEIVKILTGAAAESELPIGKIVALTEGKAELPERAERHPLSAENFARALRGDLNTQFHLLHYSGHYILNDREEGAGLLFRGDRGMVFFNLSHLRNALDRRKLKLAFFSACKSGQYEAQRSAYHLGIAHTTLRCGVPVVIGMRWIIGDDEAFTISTTFYRELAKSGRPELALWQTRRTVQADEGEGSILWAAPIMLTR
jgi:hypothetical protein